jgi:hypothetical protein
VHLNVSRETLDKRIGLDLTVGLQNGSLTGISFYIGELCKNIACRFKETVIKVNKFLIL